jgi:hypothetical protein
MAVGRPPIGRTVGGMTRWTVRVRVEGEPPAPLPDRILSVALKAQFGLFIVVGLFSLLHFT